MASSFTTTPAADSAPTAPIVDIDPALADKVKQAQYKHFYCFFKKNGSLQMIVARREISTFYYDQYFDLVFNNTNGDEGYRLENVSIADIVDFYKWFYGSSLNDEADDEEEDDEEEDDEEDDDEVRERQRSGLESWAQEKEREMQRERRREGR